MQLVVGNLLAKGGHFVSATHVSSKSHTTSIPELAGLSCMAGILGGHDWLEGVGLCSMIGTALCLGWC